MTTAEHFRDTAAARSGATMPIAGVPWPTYKVVSLLVGILVFGIVAVTTTTAAPAVLSGAGVATLAWISLGLRSHQS